MKNNIVRVDEIRSNYVIASNQNGKCLLYNVTDVSLYDILEVKGDFQYIVSNKNRHTFQFDSYMKHKQIYSSMYVTSYQTITRSKHIKAKLFNHINQTKDEEIRNYLNKVFYRMNEDAQEYSYFIYASGLHISFLIAILSKVLKTNYHKTAIVISFALMMLLPIATYMYRVFVFSLIALLFDKMHRREQLGMATIALYLISPSNVYEISFIIPVAFRIVALFDLTKLPNKLKQLLVLVPVQLYFFHECNLLSLLLFPLLRLLNGVTFMLSISSLYLKGMYPILKLLIALQEQLLLLLSYSYKMIGKPYGLWVILWIIMTVLCITYKQKKYFIILGGLLLFQMNMKLLTPFGEVTFIDVGQGDCILIREPLNGEVMLIDVAGKLNQNLPKSVIYPVLKAKGIKYIDKIVITHDDYDHSGGIDDLKSLIKVGEVIQEKQNIDLKYLHFDCYQSANPKDENDRSIILFSQINGLNYLFMADASVEVETELIDEYNQLTAHILKAGHHGSKTGSSLNFIHRIRPLLTIISSGRNNMYNHPHQEVLDTLEKEQSYVLQTKVQGSISIYFHPFFNLLINGDHSFAFLKSNN